MATMQPGSGGILSSALARNWWLLLLRGLAAIAFGVIALVWPGSAILALIFVWAVYAIADGVFSLAGAIAGREHSVGPRWWLVVVGLLGIGAGMIGLLYPAMAAGALVLLIGFWAVLVGAMQVAGAISLRKEIVGEWLMGLSGVISILLGLAFLFRPAIGALSLVWLIGAYAIVAGICFIALSFRFRRLNR